MDANPFEEALERVSPRLVKMLNSNSDPERAQILDFNPMEGRDELAETLKTMVNPDVCLTNLQENELFTDMLNYLKNPDRTKLLAMVAVINSYRNECFNCLNNECDKRDSQYPLQ